jgi:hypothetical protein
MNVYRSPVVARIRDLIERIRPQDLTDAEVLQMAAFLESVAARLAEERRPLASVVALATERTNDG